MINPSQTLWSLLLMWCKEISLMPLGTKFVWRVISWNITFALLLWALCRFRQDNYASNKIGLLMLVLWKLVYKKIIWLNSGTVISDSLKNLKKKSKESSTPPPKKNSNTCTSVNNNCKKSINKILDCLRWYGTPCLKDSEKIITTMVLKISKFITFDPKMYL